MSSYSWHPPYLRGRYAFAVVPVAAALCVWPAMLGEPQLARILVAACALLAVALLIEHDTRIDADARTVVRESRLFGRFPVWLWHHPLSEFTGVATKRESDPGGGNDTVYIGLRRRGGGNMWVCYFHAGVGQPSVEAELVARRLADTTGLPLHQDVA